MYRLLSRFRKRGRNESLLLSGGIFRTIFFTPLCYCYSSFILALGKDSPIGLSISPFFVCSSFFPLVERIIWICVAIFISTTTRVFFMFIRFVSAYRPYARFLFRFSFPFVLLLFFSFFFCTLSLTFHWIYLSFSGCVFTPFFGALTQHSRKRHFWQKHSTVASAFGRRLSSARQWQKGGTYSCQKLGSFFWL